jgi:hypothetical protein
MSRRVTPGDSIASPAATSRIACTMSAGGVSFRRKPLAPERSARSTYSSASNVVRTMISGAVSRAISASVAASPSILGMRMSMSTTSGA